MRDLTIQPATRLDAQEICDLWNSFIRSSIASFEAREKTSAEVVQKITALLEKNFGFWVARTAHTNQLQGFIYYTQFRANSGYAFTMEHSLYVAPRANGKGVGRALLEVAERDAKAKEYASFIAGISGENAPAIAFHRALGYKEIASLPKVGYKFGRWFDLVLMQKFL